MIHHLSPKFPTRLQVGCTTEKEVRRLKKIHLALADSQRDMQRTPGLSDPPPVPSQPSGVPEFLLGCKERGGSTCTILRVWASAFAGKVRAVFLNSLAFSLVAS